MALEAGSFISDLVPANPPGTDGKSQGDDHLRLLKNVLQATFPLANAARHFASVDAGATDVLTWTLHRDSPSPAVNDLLGSYAISGESSTSVERVYARWQARIDDPVNATEDGAWLGKVMKAGVETTIVEINGVGVIITGALSISGSLTGAGKPPTRQLLTAAAGTWNRPAGCRFVLVEGVGAGGGSGGVAAAAAGEAGTSGGGGSGMFGQTDFIDVAAIATGAYTNGAGGTAGNSTGTNGGQGGTAGITLGGTLYSFNPGFGSNGYSPNTSTNSRSDGGLGASTTSNVPIKGANNGVNGCHNAVGTNADGGNGGASPYGRAGDGPHRIIAGAAGGGVGVGFGAGAGGSIVVGNSGGIGGAVGAPSMILVWEFY